MPAILSYCEHVIGCENGRKGSVLGMVMATAMTEVEQLTEKVNCMRWMVPRILAVVTPALVPEDALPEKLGRMVVH